VKHWQISLAIMAALSASLALADDFKTTAGKEYKNATVSRVEPDGIVIKFHGGIAKIFFVELPPEIQKQYGYDPEAARNSQQQQQAAPSGIEGLPPITVELRDEMLSALRLTDNLDALYKRGCSSAEFIAAAMPLEGVFIKLSHKLPKGDPRRDLTANTFEAYQQLAFAMQANEQGKGERPDATLAAVGIRKVLATKLLQGNMTPDEKRVYDAWRKATEADR
jgi:hypothetical protein